MLWGKTQMFEWFSHFKKGEMSIDNQPRSGRPLKAQIEEMLKTFKDNRRSCGEKPGVTWSSVQTILSEDLGNTITLPLT